MKKFCCERFENYFKEDMVFDQSGKLIKELYPKIKIIKLEPNKLNQGRDLYRYYFVCGFMKDKPPVINMKYCPFCGIHLFDFYKTDEYINGEEKNFSL